MDELTLQITHMGSGGEGIARHEGFTFFVTGGVPGDTVLAKVVRRQKNYGVAEIKRVVSPSPQRVKPPCPVASRCGGCPLMAVNYPMQLELKRTKVADSFTRIGKLEGVAVLPCVASPESFHYRNKIQLPVRGAPGALQVGLFAKGSHHLIPIDACLIHGREGELALQALMPLLNAAMITPYDVDTGKGELRHILVKTAQSAGTALVVLVTNGRPSRALSQVAKELVATTPHIHGCVASINTRGDNVILGDAEVLLAGEDHLVEQLCGLSFKVSARSFFQVNPKQAEQLYRQAIQEAALTAEDIVLDLYCGVGTLTLIAARDAKQVIGVEYVASAINDAKDNAIRNGIENTRFLCGDVEQLIGTLPRADVVLLNPPRQGCAKEVIKALIGRSPRRIVYISCDPATLARDLSLFVAAGYAIGGAVPFDMFPQTSHVETVVSLCLSSQIT